MRAYGKRDDGIREESPRAERVKLETAALSLATAAVFEGEEKDWYNDLQGLS
jgi:hypothetical protein